MCTCLDTPSASLPATGTRKCVSPTLSTSHVLLQRLNNWWEHMQQCHRIMVSATHRHTYRMHGRGVYCACRRVRVRVREYMFLWYARYLHHASTLPHHPLLSRATDCIRCDTVIGHPITHAWLLVYRMSGYGGMSHDVVWHVLLLVLVRGYMSMCMHVLSGHRRRRIVSLRRTHRFL